MFLFFPSCCDFSLVLWIVSFLYKYKYNYKYIQCVMLFLPIGWTSNITQSIVYVFLLLNICLNPPVIYQQTFLLLLVLVLHSVHVFLVFLMSSACFLFHFFHMFSHTCLKLCVFHNFSGFLFIIFVCLFLVCFPSQNCLFLYFLISYAPFFFTFSREFWSGYTVVETKSNKEGHWPFRKINSPAHRGWRNSKPSYS